VLKMSSFDIDVSYRIGRALSRFLISRVDFILLDST